MEENTKRAILAESPLFENLLPKELSMLADLFSAREYNSGDLVFSEGDIGESLYVIAEGSVDVVRKNRAGQEHTIATLSAPLFFGEMSLIDKEYRSASIRSKGNTILLELSNANLHTFAKAYRNGFTWVVVNIARVLSKRLRDVNRRLTEKL